MKIKLLVCLPVLLSAGLALADQESHLMRYADVHGDQIVFTYEDDLWLAPAAGGDAHRITNHPGRERYAKFSPDGKLLAFTGNYDGGTDVYVMDVEGGIPRRLTYHPAAEQVLGWYPDGRYVLFRANRTAPGYTQELYRISVEGGMPEPLPVDRGGLASLSPDGRKLAFNRFVREHRTWKRYQGGWAQDIWIADFDAGTIKKVTDWPGTDNFPMWYGGTVYFTSDREDGTLNIYGYDLRSGTVTRLTPYKDYDVKYPSLGDGRIIFQYGETLNLLDLGSGKVTKVPVRIHSDQVPMRPELVEVTPRSGSFGLSPSGKRVLLEARGEILNLPAEKGDPVNLTHRSASREKDAAWSPDGRWIAFISDRSGEEEIWLVDQQGGAWRQLTKGGLGFLLPPVWSPDSRHLIYSDKFMRLNLVDVPEGKKRVIAQGGYDDAWERWGIQDYVWSPCSRWIAYTEMEHNMNESIYLYDLKTGETTRVTDDMQTSWSPSFSPDGKYLYFLSNRTFNPIMGFQDQNHVFLDMTRAYVAILKDGEPSPFMPEEVLEEVDSAADDQKGGENKDEKKDKKKDEKEDAGVPETAIDLVGLDGRIVVAEELPAGTYFRLTATEDGFLLLRRDEPEFLKYQNVNDGTTDSLDLLSYKLEDREHEVVLKGIANYHLSADGKKLIYRAGSRYGVVDAGKTAEVGDGAVDLADVRLEVVRGEEYRQQFDEAWRIQRDWFYDPNMHGVDWPAMREKYGRFVPACGNRGDLTYLIGEMIGELSTGHTYVYGGDNQGHYENVNVGVLGCDFAAEKGAGFYRITHILPGVSWDPQQRSPLKEPGCPIKEGDWLIAIDGEEVPVGDNVLRHLVDKADKMVVLTFNDKPQAKGGRTCRVRTLRGEYDLRYHEWVESNRALVDRLSGGKIGYLHLPDMFQPGLIEFARYFYPQSDKQAMIVDDRFNGGGFVGDMIIDRLERRLWGLTIPREGGWMRDPERCFHGPLAVLINEETFSNGEYFAQAIKLKGLGPLIGKRTWGGAVGIETHQNLVDGGGTSPPQFGLLGLDGSWLIEGRGVQPDIEVENDPVDLLQGKDAQLEFAVQHLLDELQRDGATWALPEKVSYPDKSRPGEGKK
jgi:tricorn protease